MSAPGEWSFVAVHDVVAAAAPDRDMVVCGPVRRTFAEVAERTRSLAAFLRGRGVGLHTERAELERWQSGQDPVALVLHNGTEYIEAMIGAFRARAVPLQRQPALSPELRSRRCWPTSGCKAIVYHRRYRPLVETTLAGRDGIVLIDVDDGSGVEPLPGSTPFEEAARTPVTEPLPATSPDDLYLVCTGGTTGRPKAVLWRQADIYVSALAGVERATVESITEAATTGTGAGGPWYPVAPLMHAAAQWTAFSGLNQGATVVVHEDSGSFDAAAVLGLAESEQVALMSIVGDAYAGPMVEELRRRPYDLRVTEHPRHRRCGHERAAQGGVARALAHARDHGRLRRVGDRRHGLRGAHQGQQDRGLRPQCRRHGDLGGPHALPRPGRAGDWAGRRGGAGYRSATCTTACAPSRPSRSSTASGWPCLATGPG